MQRGNTLEQLPTGIDAQRTTILQARETLGEIILGKNPQISLALACLLARGHFFTEALP